MKTNRFKKGLSSIGTGIKSITKRVQFSLADTSLFTSTTFQTVAKYLARFINVWQLLILLCYYGILVGLTESGKKLDTSQVGDVKLDYTFDFERWVWLFIALNIIDVKLSFGIGRKFWGPISLFSNVPVVIVNIAVFIELLLIDVINCNTSGSIFKNNMCRNHKFCGSTSAFLDLTNDCLTRNPTNMLLSPPVITENLPWRSEFIILFICQIIYTLLSIIKMVLNLTLPTNVQLVKSGVGFAASLLKKRNNSTSKKLSETEQELLDDESQLREDPSLSSSERKRMLLDDEVRLSEIKNAKRGIVEKNLYNEIQFFFGWKPWEAGLWVFNVWIVELLYGMLLLAYFGWFAQNIEYFKRPFFTLDVSTLSSSKFDYGKRNTENVIFGIVMSTNIVWFAFNHLLGDLESNWVAIVSSSFGAITQAVAVYMSYLFYTSTCNAPSSGYYNICNDVKRYCPTYWTLPSTDCPNKFFYASNPTGFSGNEFIVNPEYIFILIVLGFGVMYYVLTILTGAIILMRQKQIKEDIEKNPSESHEYVSRLDTDSRTKRHVRRHHVPFIGYLNRHYRPKYNYVVPPPVHYSVYKPSLYDYLRILLHKNGDVGTGRPYYNNGGGVGSGDDRHHHKIGAHKKKR
jgi:hypothetical protein